MAHYAFIDKHNTVYKVIVGMDENDTATLPDEFSSWEDFYKDLHNAVLCKRTSYNTYANTHSLGGTPFRGNFAGIGMIYDEVNDVFIEKQPFDSWSLDSNFIWQPPVPYPSDSNSERDTSLPVKEYQWSDSSYYADNTKGWVLVNTYVYNSDTQEWELA